jgi:hypothetical protein
VDYKLATVDYTLVAPLATRAALSPGSQEGWVRLADRWVEAASESRHYCVYFQYYCVSAGEGSECCLRQIRQIQQMSKICQIQKMCKLDC